MIKGLIFDLDSCIFDTSSMGKNLIKPILEAMISVDKEKFITKEAYKKIKQCLWTDNLEDVVKLNKIPKNIARAMREASLKLEVPACSKNYDDVGCIKKVDLVKILVTTGYYNFQLNKIRKTGIEPYFNEIIIDAIDDPKRIKGKLTIFKKITIKYGWRYFEVLVLGDNPNSELRVGKDLSMITAQTLRPGVKKIEGFDFYIKSFSELGKIINTINYKQICVES